MIGEWTLVNNLLRHCNEAEAEEMLDNEIMGKHRKQFMLRIHSRVNFLRASRERGQLIDHSRS